MDSGEWILSDKVCEESGNIGTNIEYSLNYGEVKNFTSTNVRIVDILYVDYFLENVDTVISKYYYGKTSDGLYNDDTGNAYYVKYAEDGTVRTLYCGKFKNGKFHDNTNDSWYITKNDDTDYMYYKGKFDMNEKVKNEGHDFENPVTVEHIQEIIKDKRFKCDLKWYE